MMELYFLFTWQNCCWDVWNLFETNFFQIPTDDGLCFKNDRNETPIIISYNNTCVLSSSCSLLHKIYMRTKMWVHISVRVSVMMII